MTELKGRVRIRTRWQEVPDDAPSSISEWKEMEVCPTCGQAVDWNPLVGICGDPWHDVEME